MAGCQVASNVGMQRPGGQLHGSGIFKVFGLDQDAHDHLEQFRTGGLGPSRDGGIAMGALAEEVMPVHRCQGGLQPALSVGVDFEQEIAKEMTVLDRCSEQHLDGHFMLALRNHRPGLGIKRGEPSAQERGLTARRSWRLLLQDVLDFNGMTPRRLVGRRQKERSDPLAFERQERSSGDFCVVERHGDSCGDVTAVIAPLDNVEIGNEAASVLASTQLRMGTEQGAVGEQGDRIQTQFRSAASGRWSRPRSPEGGLQKPAFPYVFRTTNENGTRKCRKSLIYMVGDAGFEPATPAV